MARDPMQGLLIGVDEEPEAGEESEDSTEEADEGELSAAQAALDAVSSGDAQAFLDAIKLLRG